MSISTNNSRIKNERKKTLLGVDIGATKVEIGFVHTTGDLLASYKYPTNPEKAVGEILSDLTSWINECCDRTGFETDLIGIGVAGQIGFEGNVISAPNLNWSNVPLKQMMEQRLQCKVIVLNDVRAATYGEWIYGSGTGYTDLVVLFVGTGVGGGVISGGKMLRGCSNSAGELGHTTIITGGRQCHCPNKGCLESYVGGWAIAERAKEAVMLNPHAGSCLVSFSGQISNITAAIVSKAYYTGDKLAIRLIDETCTYLASGLVSIINVFNPCLVIFGGGIIEGLPHIIQKVEVIVRNNALNATLKNLKFTKAALGNQAGVIGAATYAWSVMKKISYASKL